MLNFSFLLKIIRLFLAYLKENAYLCTKKNKINIHWKITIMKKKIYGKLIATYQKNSDGSKSGLMNRTLEIYELKSGLKGVLWSSSSKGWKDNDNNIMSVAKFNYADRDATEYRVCEYFGGGYELKSRK